MRPGQGAHHGRVIDGAPSSTAWSAAAHRAAHQVLDGARIFPDPMAIRILGEDAERAVQRGRDPAQRPMRLFIAARHRVAEDAVAVAVAAGTRQVVVLGAGLDTFAYRPRFPGLDVVEIDHPSTQEWKRRRLSETGIDVPAGVRYAGVDFERTDLESALDAAGIDRSGRPVFLWLGVLPYLTRPTVLDTLQTLARIPGATAIFDYPNPADQLSERGRDWHARRAAAVRDLGEPWLTFFDNGELADVLAGLGWQVVDRVGPREIAVRWFGAPPETPARSGGHIAVVRSAG